MKLSQLLAQLNQVEKTKFINCIDSIRAEVIKKDPKIAKELSSVDGQLKSASGREITLLFDAVKTEFKEFLREQLSLASGQISLLVNILARDGNGIARISWIESLYAKEHQRLQKMSKELLAEIQEAELDSSFGHGIRLSIYKDCFETAYKNDERVNREAKVTDDERTILNTLSSRLGLTTDETFAVENLIEPIKENDVAAALECLREIGLLFIDKKKLEVLVADEVVDLIHDIQGKELKDKHVLRILRSLSDSELSNILKNHDQKIRGVSRQEKIQFVSHAGLPIRSILSKDIFSGDETQNHRKDRLKQMIEDLELDVARIGVTLDDRIDVVIGSLQKGFESEFNSISVSGFKDLLGVLSETSPSVTKRIQQDFEIEPSETLDPDRLKALGISPLDILYIYSNDEIKCIRDDLKLSKRLNPRTAILELFASANDRLIENFELLASRDLAALNSLGIDIKEAELGIKFEEVTRSMLEQLGLNVDEELRKQISTAKDKADIILSVGGDDVIIGEVKSHKNGDYSKYATTSRQVKSYVNRCESNGKRVAQVLIIAPSFSTDFIESAEMDTEINISLLEAAGLKEILKAYTSKKNPKFSEKLLTKGGLLKASLIAKTI